MTLPDFFRISLLLIGVGVLGGEIGPVRVLPDDRSRSGEGISATTTVYGFLDFTTKIDDTVVVFKPSTASAAASTAKATVATIVHAPRRSAATTTPPASPPTLAPSLPPTRRNRFSSPPSTTPSYKRPTTERQAPRVYIRKRVLAGRRPTENSSQRNPGSNAGKLIPRRPVGKYQLRLRPTPTEAPVPVHVPVGDVTDAPRAPRHHALSLQEARAVEVTTTTASRGFSSTAAYTPTESPNENIAEYLPEDGDRPSANLAVEEEGPLIRGSEADPLPGAIRSQTFSEDGIEATAALPILITGSEGEDEHSSPTVSAGRGLTVPLQLSIVTSSYSLTETMLRTSLLPVYDGTSTTFYTLTQSFLVTKTVTSYQTVPPEEFMPYLIPGNNSINEVDPFPEASDHLEHRTKKDPPILPHNNDVNDVAGSGELSNGSLAVYGPPPPPVSNPLMGPQGGLPLLNLLNPGLAAALGFNPYLAAAYGLGMGAPQVLTTSRPIYSTQVLMTEKLLPVIDGFSTSYETIQAPAGVVTHTSYETFTTTTLGSPGNPMQHHGLNPLLAPSTITVSTTYVTTEPITHTQVFKLVYDGYKTSYRTVSSISETTRTISTHITTTTLPTAPTQLLPFFG